MATLFDKLNLKDQSEIVVVGAPASLEPELARLKGVAVVRDVKKARSIEFLLAFVTKQAEVDSLASLIDRKAQGDAVVWFAYPKKTSKKYTCEFHRDTGWASLGDAGFEGVRLVAIDEDWSAMRFRRAEFIRTLKRDPARAMSRTGKARTAGKGAR
jgi:hypothetical protein